jgi:hypothetical protein
MRERRDRLSKSRLYSSCSDDEPSEAKLSNDAKLMTNKGGAAVRSDERLVTPMADAPDRDNAVDRRSSDACMT